MTMTVLDGHRITITAPLFMLQQNENLLCSHADQTGYGGGTIRCGDGQTNTILNYHHQG